ncbi:MAG: TrkH family potassium uptake protein [Myxococcales bacterium]|nr:TrkH family potassium uptake protein [Myxococcales bacterium]
MNPHIVAKLTSRILAIVGILMLAPVGIAIFDGGGHTLTAFGVSLISVMATAGALNLLGRNATDTVHRKDAIGVVGMCWLLLGVFGALPFVIEGSIAHPASAVFEAVSGFTTTGATVVADVDGLSRATNLWRCLSHWIGGMGIVVLFVAIFPTLGVGAKHLFRSEVAGPINSGLRPKIKQTALALWWIYGGLTVLCTVLLMLAGMPLFDAVCHAFSTLGTGGFSTKGASVGHFNSAAIDWIIIVFMLIAGLNFGLYYEIARGRADAVWRNYEVRFYVVVNLLIIGVIFLSTQERHGGVLDAVRFASFQTLAVTTTTGFMTEDFDAYPNFARYLLFLAMFMGGCAGSTAGGLKVSRVYALFKLAARELRLVVQPQAIISVRLGRSAVQPSVVHSILVFVAAYFGLFGICSAFMVLLGLDLITAMSSVIACLSSIGPGLAGVGPTMNFEFIPPIGKLVLSFCMIAGRLEIFVLLAILTPEVWRR